MGYQMLGVAVAWQMYALTGSAFDLGLVGLMQFLPAAAFMLVAGQIADRYDRRRLLQIWQTVEGLAAAALAIGSVSGWVTKEFILAAVFVFGVGRAFEAPTQQTLLPNVVPTSLFPRAIAASSSTTQLATIAGPAVGGSLYILGPTGSLHDLLRALFRLGRSADLRADRTFRRDAHAHQPRAPSSPAFPTSAAVRSCSASSRSTCSRSCSAAPPRCCRSSPTRSSISARKGSACCAHRRPSARWRSWRC